MPDWPGWRVFAERVLDLVYPTRCLVCDADFAAGGSPLLCGVCESGLVPIAPPACRRCGQALDPECREVASCANCAGRELAFEWAVAFGRYEGVLREAIHRFKFHGTDLLARPFAERLAHVVRARAGTLTWDAVVPVPASQENWFLRARNPAELLARELASCLGLPYRHRWLRKIRSTPPQSALDRRMRLRNLHGCMEVVRRKEVAGSSILVVDDILTTGATAGEAARALVSAGARMCHVATVAR